MEAVSMLQRCIGFVPKLRASGHLLGITLMGINGMVHPSIMTGKWWNYDGEQAFEELPLFYGGVNDEGAQIMSFVSDEVVSIARTIMEARPQIDLTNVVHIYQWYINCYSNDIKDKSS